MAILPFTAPLGDREISFRFQVPGGEFATGRFEIHGLLPGTLLELKDKTALKKAFFVGVSADQPILGSHGVKDGILWFAPRFPVPPKVEHFIRFDFNSKNGVLEKPGNWRFTWDQMPSPETRVKAVYPSAEKIPENTLRFYIHFSQPMKKGQAASRVHIRNGQGKLLELPFLELDEELWDAQQTRLTLFIDPGRIKRGLKPLEEEGPVLEAGNTYNLEVERDFEDATGKPLEKGWRKTIKVGPAVREQINPSLWNVVPPKTSEGFLEIRLNKPLDHALLQSQLHITNRQEQGVSGSWEVGNFETIARFRSKGPWIPGQYRIKLGWDLEDPSGNRIDRVFDAAENEKPKQTTLSLPFSVGN